MGGGGGGEGVVYGVVDCMLCLIWISKSIRLMDSVIWAIPAMPEMEAFMAGESVVLSTWVTPRMVSIRAVRFKPI